MEYFQAFIVVNLLVAGAVMALGLREELSSTVNEQESQK